MSRKPKGINPKHAAFPDGMRPGLKMRDYLAAVAMNGLLTHGGSDPETVASEAYEIADAMIARSAQRVLPPVEA
jgi:hypothetical protein